MKKKERIGTIGIFTALFALCMALRVYYFMSAGKSMICEADAIEQHINALIAYGKWIRGWLWSIANEHTLIPQTYSFGIGNGADFYTSMQYYAVGDPLNLPAAFLPSDKIYYYFQFLMLLRPYLAGLAFIALCFSRKRPDGSGPSAAGIIAGAMIYSFSGTVLFIGMWNPFFVSPMITLPLLVIGADALIEKGRLTPLILAAFLAGVTNFYFMYMQVIFITGYFIIRLVMEKETAGRRLKLSLHFILSGAVGVLMGAVLLFPMFLALLGNPRSGGHEIGLFYEGEHYLQLLKNLILYIYHPLYDTELCLTVTIVPVLILACIFAKKWELCRERVELILMVLMLVFPAAGYVMSGMAYAINRWCFAFALLGAWLTAAVWDRVLKKRAASIAVLALTVVFVLNNIRLADSPEAGNLPSGYVDRMTGAEFMDRMMLTEVNALEQSVIASTDTHVRYAGQNLVWNASLLHGISSTQFYWSLANGPLAELYSELAVNDMANYSYLGWDDRMILNDMAGVTHYTLRFDSPEEQRVIPAGFVRAGEYYNFALYENALPVGLGTVMDSAMPKSEWLAHSPWEREELLARTAVLPDDELQNAENAGVRAAEDMDEELTSDTLPFEISCGDGVTWIPEGSGGTFEVSEEWAEAVVSFEGFDAAETGLYLENLVVSGPRDIVNIRVTGIPSWDPEAVVEKTVSYKTPDSEFYSGWHDYIVNFGCGAAPFDTAVITFPSPGRYTVSGISVVTRPVEDWLSLMEEPASNAVAEVSLNKNPVSLMTGRIDMTASSDSYGVLMLTIPWQSGWRAEVDGVGTELIKTDTAFTGLLLTPGTHDVVMTYRTPGLIAGMLMTVAGFALLILIRRLEVRGDRQLRGETDKNAEEGDTDE